MRINIVISCLVLSVVAGTAHGLTQTATATNNQPVVRSEASMPRLVKPTVVRTIETAAGSLRGRVLAHGTRTLVQQIGLKLRKEDDKSVVALTTQKDGTFKTPVLQAGSYTLILDGVSRSASPSAKTRRSRVSTSCCRVAVT